MFCYRSCLSLHVALICTAWCRPHVYMGVIHVLTFQLRCRSGGPLHYVLLTVEMERLWHVSKAPRIHYLSSIWVTVFQISEVWKSYPRPLMRATQSASSTQPSPNRNFHQILSTRWICYWLVYGLTIPSLFPGHYPSNLCPTSGHTSLCVSRFLAHSLLSNPRSFNQWNAIFQTA